MFLVAFGLFQSEIEENWEWFMRQLHRSIGDVSPLVISTDACKGLINAVRVVFPHAEQRECHAHLMLNLYKRYSGTVYRYMWTAARAYKPESYKFFMDKIHVENSEFALYLERHHILLWMRSDFNPEIKCDYINNNHAETVNN
jgi:transposase-like protein